MPAEPAPPDTRPPPPGRRHVHRQRAHHAAHQGAPDGAGRACIESARCTVRGRRRGRTPARRRAARPGQLGTSSVSLAPPRRGPLKPDKLPLLPLPLESPLVVVVYLIATEDCRIIGTSPWAWRPSRRPCPGGGCSDPALIDPHRPPPPTLLRMKYTTSNAFARAL